MMSIKRRLLKRIKINAILINKKIDGFLKVRKKKKMRLLNLLQKWLDL
jgi:hypothetical protein